MGCFRTSLPQAVEKMRADLGGVRRQVLAVDDFEVRQGGRHRGGVTAVGITVAEFIAFVS